jgi:hypothetical protein
LIHVTNNNTSRVAFFFLFSIFFCQMKRSHFSYPSFKILIKQIVLPFPKCFLLISAYCRINSIQINTGLLRQNILFWYLKLSKCEQSCQRCNAFCVRNWPV